MNILTVSQLNRYIKSIFEENKKLSNIYISGEISNFNSHYSSGHFYFSLKDTSSNIRCVMFKTYASLLGFEPTNGMAVLVCATVNVYEREGTYQLYVTDLQPYGAGAMAIAFEQRKARLSQLGMFSDQFKKPLPKYPTRIGVVTSQNGAALQDILTTINSRYPICTVVISPATVQGEGAAQSIITALETLDKTGKCDVIILGRGGGSLEDLWCFNDEKLAHCIFAAKTPIISGVGHETDYTITDFVADVRAATPTAAAQIAVPSFSDIEKMLFAYKNQLFYSINANIVNCKHRLDVAQSSRALSSIHLYIAKNKEKLDFLSQKLYNKKNTFFIQHTQTISQKAQLLDSLSPLSVLERGYCAAYQQDLPVISVEKIAKTLPLSVKFKDGVVLTQILKVDKEGTV